MIRRPINSQFSAAVLEGRKYTTIRDNPWPTGVPIMLYYWSGAAYRSPQISVCAVVASICTPISIAKTHEGSMRYAYALDTDVPLWRSEGFPSREAMDAWFGARVEPGQLTTKALMRFFRVPDYDYMEF